MTRLAMFYHIWAPDGPYGWPLLVDEQLKRILRSELPSHADIFCCICGPAAKKIVPFAALHQWLKLAAQTESEAEYEGFTLKHLHQYAQTERYDAIGYIHTKGLSHSSPDGNLETFRNVNSWRHMMETVIIDDWRLAVAKLATHDIAGAIYKPEPWPHYSGNFWWATTKYLRTLPHPVLGLNVAHNFFGANERLSLRTQYERWIGLNEPNFHDFYKRPLLYQGKRLTASDDFDMFARDVGPYYLHNLR